MSLLVAAPSASITSDQGHAHARADAGAPPELLQVASRPIGLKPNIGAAHDPVGTRSPQAQALYDQGLAYLHSYWWLEAARSFNQALATDRTLSIAHAMLSLAYTELNAPQTARQEMATSTAAAPQASDHDRRHIAIRAMQLNAEAAGRWADAASLTRFRAAIDEALRAYPQDEEFWLLRGLAESSDPAERGQGTGASSIPFFQKALALAPGRVGPRHYLTHAYENTGRIAEALAEGATYAKMAPGVPHARHMYGHNLRRSGRIDEAIVEFSAADALETAYFDTERIGPEYDWHYQHNVDLLATSYQYVGQMTKAERLLKRSFGIRSTLVEQEYNKREWPVFLIGRGRPTEALDAATAMAAHPHPLVSAAGHVMIGQARLALGEYKAAADEANVALRQMRAAPMGAGLVANALQQLQGEFLLRTGEREKGRQMLRDLVTKIRASTGPDAWAQALFTLESIARTARAVGDWEFTAWTANQMLEHDPHYGGGHYELALIAQHRGEPSNAAAEFGLAKKYWKNADPDVLKLLQ